VENCQYREGVAERTMHNVPDVKDALRVSEEYETAGERYLLPDEADDGFELGVAGGQKAAGSADGVAEVSACAAQCGELEGHAQIHGKHFQQSQQWADLADVFGRWDAEYAVKIFGAIQQLSFESISEFVFAAVEFC
jgi:hypothetical protein